MAKEKQLENKVKQFLKNNGCWFVKYWAGAQFTQSGIPDILACCNGKFFGIEIKADNGRASPLQIHNLKQIQLAGGVPVLLYPKDFERFKRLVLKNDFDEKLYFLEELAKHEY